MGLLVRRLPQFWCSKALLVLAAAFRPCFQKKPSSGCCAAAPFFSPRVLNTPVEAFSQARGSPILWSLTFEAATRISLLLPLIHWGDRQWNCNPSSRVQSHSATETMPTDVCQYIYDCKGCGYCMKPIKGKCCVYCSYGSVPCPPIQSGMAAASEASCVSASADALYLFGPRSIPTPVMRGRTCRAGFGG